MRQFMRFLHLSHKSQSFHFLYTHSVDLDESFGKNIDLYTEYIDAYSYEPDM